MKERMFAQFREIFDDLVDSTTVFSISSRFNSKLNIFLLRFLVNELGMKGVFISIDRPTYYVRKLLKAKGVELDNIIFLDAIQKVSGDTNPYDGPTVRLMDNPFSSEMLDRITGRGTGIIENEGLDFMIIDNLSVLSCYVDEESIKELFGSLAGRAGMTTLMVIDKDCNDMVYGIVKGFCDNEVSLTSDMALDLQPIEDDKVTIDDR